MQKIISLATNGNAVLREKMLVAILRLWINNSYVSEVSGATCSQTD